jgi:hypothetical protein
MGERGNMEHVSSGRASTNPVPGRRLLGAVQRSKTGTCLVREHDHTRSQEVDTSQTGRRCEIHGPLAVKFCSYAQLDNQYE